LAPSDAAKQLGSIYNRLQPTAAAPEFDFRSGGGFDEDNSFGRLGAEWQLVFSALPGLAFRVDGVFGILGGITYYFGADASLKDRHRRQDPDSALFSLFQTVQQEQAKLCAKYGPC